MLKPPRPAQRPYLQESPHGQRPDPYHWLRDDSRRDPEVISHLQAENAYFEAMTAHTKAQEEALYIEIISHINQNEDSVPYQKYGWWYQTRYEKGKEYPIYLRWREGEQPQVLLDINVLAAGHAFFQVGALSVHPAGDLLAWAEDTVGNRQYTLKIRILSTGEDLPDQITGCSTSLAWADDTSLYYIKNDPETLRTRWIKRHFLRTEATQDAVVFDEADESFYVSVSRSACNGYLVINSQATISSEIQVSPAAGPPAFVSLAPRERGLEYDAEHIENRWIIHTNLNAVDFCLMQVADDKIGDRGAWQLLQPQQEGVFISNFLALKDWLVIGERSGGLRRIRLKSWDGREERLVASDEPAYSMWIGTNPEQNTEILRYNYISMTTPESVYALNLRTGERQLLKQQTVPEFSQENYISELHWIAAADGVKVPVSLVRHRQTTLPAPTLVYGYGAYGFSMDPSFSASRLVMLDRGFVFAIAHIRGGQEMGRRWYDQGRLLNKKNSFTDFIDVTTGLVDLGIADPKHLCAMGGSAGGLLMGAVLNMRPDLFQAMVAQVPFVDAVSTMLDTSLPLTTNEFDEWGDPREKEYYDYILSYSPYDNVKPAHYPAILVTSGLWDSQVQYFEPAKWVARLRDNLVGGGPILEHMEMEAGHGGKSGRFQRYQEIAREYAFLLDRVK